MSHTFIIRPATIADASAVARVHVESWRVAYREILSPAYIETRSMERREALWRTWVAEPADPRNFLLVAEAADREIVGFASGGAERTPDPEFVGEVQSLYLLPAWLRRGIGRALMTHAAWALQRRAMNSMLVWAFERNAACGFYERLGGRPVREKIVDADGKQLAEVGFGWADLAATFGPPSATDFS
jgi:GNAT superfamily N-acetyltransferase